MQCEASVPTPGGQLQYRGDARIDGVPGTAAPVKINFLQTAGSVCPSMLPSGKLLDLIHYDTPDGVRHEVQVTLIDNGMPMVLVRAADFGISGAETPAQLNANEALRTRLEALRLAAGAPMGLGDVSKKNYPKMCLLAAPASGGAISTRCFIPHVCHDAIGVLAALTVATACVLEGTIAQGLAQAGRGLQRNISVEHPTGEFTVELQLDAHDQQRILSAALLRTARPIMRGEVLVPADIWNQDKS